MIDIIKIYNEEQSIKKIVVCGSGHLRNVTSKHEVDHYFIPLAVFMLSEDTIPTLEKSEEYNNAFGNWVTVNDKFNILYEDNNRYMTPSFDILPSVAMLGYHIKFIKECMK